jgi:transcriptional regulator with XRE-family HTH domain
MPVMTVARAFGRVLRQLRIEAGVTQEGLALSADLARPYMSMLEKGNRNPSLATVFQLAAARGVEPSEMVVRVQREVRRAKNRRK